jgi:TetR/AcrR family transcriptional regulator, mexJK operon transcriptional repressor
MSQRAKSISAARRHAVVSADASARKRAAIVAAAQAVFLEVGYGAAGMDEIARRAGVAKQTIYNHFGGKDALFGEIITRLCDDLLRPLSRPELRAGAPEAALTALGREVMALMLQPSSLALHRLLVAEAPRFPELGRAAWRAGGERPVAALAGWLQEQTRQGALAVADAALAAEQFFGLLVGHIQIRALLGIETEPPQAVRDAAVREAVRTFLARYAAG